MLNNNELSGWIDAEGVLYPVSDNDSLQWAMDTIRKNKWLEELKNCRHPFIQNYNPEAFLLYEKGWVLLTTHPFNFPFPIKEKEHAYTVGQTKTLLQFYAQLTRT